MLFVHGAIPFAAMPTLGQAVWTSGFAQSFVNDSLLSVHASNFGAPQPAPIAFGLAGAWPVALFVAGGLHPADAYSAMVAFWLSIAFLSAFSLSRMLGVSAPLSIAGAALWLTMPMIWAHAGYSMLSLGIALLPSYFLCALLLLNRSTAGCILLYILACHVAVFMDGYSFMMFGLGASVVGVWLFIGSPSRRQTLLRRALPAHVIGMAIACVAYIAYMGGVAYEPAPLEHFRAWGMDVAFLSVPTQGVHWIPDALGLSASRSEDRFFGDPSVWRTTFALPLLLAAVWAWWRVRRTSALASGVLLLMLASLYLSLGPSLKLNASKPPGAGLERVMPEGYSLAPTGSALLSTRVPGFRDMRAAYRWLALSVLSAWLLLMILLSSPKRADVVMAAALAGGVAIVNLPDVERKWVEDRHNREMFLRLDAELLDDMRQTLERRERVAFLPYGNDFLVNYLAARLGIVAYNIGGDKNLEQARRHWPELMRQFREGSVDEAFASKVMLLLARREADSVVLPFVDMLSAAHRWPAAAHLRPALRPAIATMRNSNFVQVTERDHYAVVRLAPATAPLAPAGILDSRVLAPVCLPPVCLMHKRFARAIASRHGRLHASDSHRLAAGRFRIAVYGKAAAAPESWIEVVSGRAGVTHARLAFAERASGRLATGLLAEGAVTLESQMDDVEVRVFVSAQDTVALESFDLVPRGR
jgi:hypothetical protein